MNPSSHPVVRILPALSVATFVLTAVVALRLPIVDDAYISFRYAWNLVHGNGLVFNPGEVVEGYSNFLWMLLSAGSLALGIDAPNFARVAGLAFSLATVVLVLIHLRDVPPAWRAVAAVWLCTSMIFIRASANGLETAFFGCLVLLAFANDRAGSPRTAAAIFALAALCRFEGVLFFSVWWVARTLAAGREEGADRAVPLAIFAAIFVPYFAWRWAHFGSPVPNTLLLRQGAPLLALTGGLAYLAKLALVSPVVFLPLVARRGWSDPMRLSVLAFLVYVVAVGGDSLDSFRFAAPVLPLGIVLTVRGLSGLRRWAGIALAVLLTIWLGGMSFFHYVHVGGIQAPGEKQFVLMTEAVSRVAEPGDKVATAAIGQIGYRNPEVVIVDLLGVVDPVIARGPMDTRIDAQAHRKYDPFRVLSREPDFFFPLANPRPGSLPGTYSFAGPAFEQALVDQPAFRERYALRQVEAEPGIGVWYFERVDMSYE